MGVRDLVTAFNAVASPRYTCQRAFLGYDRAHDTEWQILTFSGISAGGSAFEVRSEALRPNSDLNAAAAAAAKKLLEQGTPTP
jgi:hypothetical protein